MRLKPLALLLALVIAIPFLTACSPSARDEGEAIQKSVVNKAMDQVPVPDLNNFLNRQAVSEYMERMDDPNKTFFVYILGMNGNVIGYYTTSTHPVTTCELLTPPEEYYSQGATVDAPKLSGLYGKGGNCEHYVAFTADTDTMIEWSQDFFISDQPLAIEADRLDPPKESN